MSEVYGPIPLEGHDKNPLVLIQPIAGRNRLEGGGASLSEHLATLYFGRNTLNPGRGSAAGKVEFRADVSDRLVCSTLEKSGSLWVQRDNGAVSLSWGTESFRFFFGAHGLEIRSAGITQPTIVAPARWYVQAGFFRDSTANVGFSPLYAATKRYSGAGVFLPESEGSWWRLGIDEKTEPPNKLSQLQRTQLREVLSLEWSDMDDLTFRPMRMTDGAGFKPCFMIGSELIESPGAESWGVAWEYALAQLRAKTAAK